MIYDIEISDQAEIDLRGIFEYIAFELHQSEMVGAFFMPGEIWAFFNDTY